MKDLSRRGFLGAAAASPMVAKEMAQRAAENAAGVAVVGHGAQNSDVAIERRTKAARLFHRFGLPEWKKRELRRRAGRFRILDADLATMQSLSLAAKLRIQQQRNYDRMCEEEMTFEWADARDKFLQDNGLDWA